MWFLPVTHHLQQQILQVPEFVGSSKAMYATGKQKQNRERVMKRVGQTNRVTKIPMDSPVKLHMIPYTEQNSSLI